MSYVFEKLVVDQNDPRQIDAVFYKAPEQAFGTEWPASRFVMSASDLDGNGDAFTKLVKNPAPKAVEDAKVALKDHFDMIEARAQCPSVLAGRTLEDIPPEISSVKYSTGTVIPFDRNVA